MKITLSNNDHKEIQEDLMSSEVRFIMWLKTFSPKVGDILVRKEYNLDDNNAIESSSYEHYHNSILQTRYLVVYVDDNAFFYKEIKENGKLDTSIHNSAELIQEAGYSRYSIFEVDPLYVDSIIMGDDFDIGHLLEQERKRKKDLIDKNKKSSVTFSDLKSVNNLIKSLSKGETIYYHPSSNEEFKDNRFTSLSLDKTRKIKVCNFEGTRRCRKLLSKKSLAKSCLNDRHVLYLKDTKNGRLITTAELIGEALYRNKPFVLKDQL